MWVVVTVMLLGGVTVGRKRRILSRVMSYRDFVEHVIGVFRVGRSFWSENGVDILEMSCVLKDY